MISRFLIALITASAVWTIWSTIAYYDAPLWALWLVIISIFLVGIRNGANVLARRLPQSPPEIGHGELNEAVD